MSNYILIAGSRDFENRNIFAGVLLQFMVENDPLEEYVIVEGGARGVDTMAREFAEENGLQVKEFRSDWKKYGRAAGPKRNDEMTAFTAEHNGQALYFWDGQSKGTKQCIMSARKRGIPVTVWNTTEGRKMKEGELPT